MENVIVALFLIGVLVLLVLGVITMFFGITADDEEDLPFTGKRWLWAVMCTYLVAVAVGWPVVLSNSMPGLVLSGIFLFAAVGAASKW
jgi:hypothetical protein